MKQLLKAVVASSLLVVSCTFAPTPLTFKTATLQLSMSGLFPSQRQLQYLVPGSKARVSVSGAGLTDSLVQTAPISGETMQITLSGLPTGPNRLVTVESLDEAGQPIPGGRYRTTMTLAEGGNAGVLSAASTVRGDVFDALLAAKSDLARTLDAGAVQAKIDEIKEAQRVAHYGLIDGGAIALRLQQNGGQVATLDKTDASLIQAPTQLLVKVAGLPDSLQAAVWLDDPVSPKQSGLGNGNVTIQPVKPGTWQLYGRAGAFRLGPVPIDLTTSAKATLDFSSARILPQAMPQGRGGAASGVLSLGGQEVLAVAGGTLIDHGANVSTDSLIVFDGTTWAAKAPMPVAVSHAAFTTNGNKLYVLGGYSTSGMTDVVQVYDAAKDQWSTSLPPLKYSSFLAGAACLDNTLYVTSGIVPIGNSLGADWSIYKLPLDGSATAWQEFGLIATDPQLRFSRFGCTVTGVAGKLYTFGGMDSNGNLIHRVECYDPLKATVMELTPMPTARHGAFAWVKGSKVYVMGGIDGTGKALATVEVYDAATDTWSVQPNLREARGHAAIGEIGGKGMVAGGNDGFYLFKEVSVRSTIESLVF